MASIQEISNRDGTVRYRVFYRIEGRPDNIAFDSGYSRKQVERFKVCLEEVLQAYSRNRDLESSVETFILEHPDFRRKLEQKGFFEEEREYRLGELFDRFLSEKKATEKISTLRTYETARKRFFHFFSEKLEIGKLTKSDGIKWKQNLKAAGYAEASIAGSIQRLNAFLNWAAQGGYVESNPFRGIPRGSFINENREHFVTMNDYEKLLDACPDQTWRTLLALCRIGGLRNPSETLLVKWVDVDWEKGSLLVHSPKTEHHAGKETRVIPLFPKLREELEKSFDLADDGTTYVIDKWRDTAANMRTHFRRIIFRAGLSEWDRLFQNLRQSRANEIGDAYPEHVESAWLGHSKRTAKNHYLRVTDGNFQRALVEGQAAPYSAKPTEYETEYSRGEK